MPKSPNESPNLKEEEIPDVIMDMILVEVEETAEYPVEFAYS